MDGRPAQRQDGAGRSHLRTRDAKQQCDDRTSAYQSRADRRPRRQAGISVDDRAGKGPDGWWGPRTRADLRAGRVGADAVQPAGAASDGIGRSNKPPSTRKRVDVDEVIRRLQGGGAPSDSEE